MSIFRTLVIKEWARFFLGSLFILFLLVTVANLVSGFLRSNVTTEEVLINYLIEIPKNFNQIIPVSCLIASLFSVNKLKNRNELTAMFASGFSRKKYVLTVIQASIVAALIQFAIGAYGEPYMKKQRHVLLPESSTKFRNLKEKGLSTSTIYGGRIWFKSDDYFFSFAKFDKANNTLEDVYLYKIDKNQKLNEVTRAPKIKYKDANEWLAEHADSFRGLNHQVFPTISTDQKETISLAETPLDFKQIESDITTLHIGALFQYVSKLKQSGINTDEYEVIFINKISSSVICLIFSILALVAIFNPNRRTSSFGKNIAFIFVFTIFYWLVYSYFLELGKNSSINPWVACFTVPVLFLLYIVHFFYRNRVLR